MNKRDESHGQNRGTLISIRGSVVDAQFPGHLPSIYHVLRAGDDGGIVIEVLTHLDSKTIRGIALTSTQGLAHGSTIIDAGRPLGKRETDKCPSHAKERSEYQQGFMVNALLG